MKQKEQKEQKEQSKPNKKRKWPWILLSVFLILGILIAILVKWQWNNIMAVHYATTYSEEELHRMQEENDKIISEITGQISDIDVSRLPEEARELLQKGELSEETAVAILTGKITWEEYKETQQVPADTTTYSPGYTNDIIAQIYVLRSSYTGKLDSLVSQAWGEYRSGGISKTDLISKYVGIGYGLEAECDGKMEALLSQLSDALAFRGEDLSLVDTIRRTYQSEKSIKKAEMIAKYQK